MRQNPVIRDVIRHGASRVHRLNGGLDLYSTEHEGATEASCSETVVWRVVFETFIAALEARACFVALLYLRLVVSDFATELSSADAVCL